ncbi:MAG: GFA family protein [Gammaproteobacteria bacterium]
MSGLTGSWHCGVVNYAVDGEVKRVVNCHCNLCRNMNGTAFSSYAIVSRDELSIIQGQDSLRQYAATETAHKHFCDQCGTPPFNTNPKKYGEVAML